MKITFNQLFKKKNQQTVSPPTTTERLELVYEKDTVHDWRAMYWQVTDSTQCVATRIPSPQRQRYQIEENQTYENILFTLGGKRYQGVSDLKMNAVMEDVWRPNYCGIPDIVAVYRCRYGKTVMYIKEQFPCYDRYDRLYEKRFDHYFYVFDNKKLSLLRYSDTAEEFWVLDDIDKVHWLHLRKMREYHVFPFEIVP